MGSTKMWHPAFVESAHPQWRRTLLLRRRSTYQAKLWKLSKRMTSVFSSTGLSTQESYTIWSSLNKKHSYTLHKLITVNEELESKAGIGLLR